MTTAILPPFIPGMGTRRAALILERLENERLGCGAAFGLLVDRTGQIIAADGPIERAQLETLAVRLVPVFLASRSLSRTFHQWPVRATLEDGDRLRLITLPLDDQWLLAMAFDLQRQQPAPERFAQRWTEQFVPLIPQAKQQRQRQQRSAIVQDGVNLIFKDE